MELVVVASVLVFALALYALFSTRSRAPRRSLASMLKLLRRVPVFETLTKEHLQRVALVIRELHVPPNVYVIREHRAGEAMFVVISGTLQILKRGVVDENLVQTVGPGEILGEMALLTGGKRIASARALTACSLLQIDRDDFDELLAANHDVMKLVWDACERHSIRLVMADHASTRAVPLERRDAWIGRRTVAITVADETLSPPLGTGYAALIAGTFSVNGHDVQAPYLVIVEPGTRLVAARAGRVAWLTREP